MKKLLFAASAATTLLGWSSLAHASDIGLAPASYDWSGGYLGVNAGVGINMSEFSSRYRYTGAAEIGVDDDTPELMRQLGSSEDASGTSFSGGFNYGYNWQYNRFVLGFEGDFNYIGLSANGSRNVSEVMDQVFTNPTTSARDRYEMSGDWYGTLRARLGFAADNWLFYGTGGLAYGDVSASQKLTASNEDEFANWSGDSDKWKMGWTAGAGVEYGLDRWTLGLEYLYVDLGSVDWSTTPNLGLEDGPTEDIWADVNGKGSMDYNFSVVRALVKYRF